MRVAAQHPHEAMFHASAAATLQVTHASPAVAGVGLTEGYVTRPILAAAAAVAGGRLELRGMLNLEGLTLQRGELNAGISGEGYVDRRHPHTYLHEFVASLRGPLAGADASVSAGRGFAPFGTDDPMSRPFARFPANHHLAQILERWIVVGAVRTGVLTLEGGLFNGDEPTGPSSLGQIERFADSWSARATVRPTGGLEVQASHARVASPEHEGGAGLDQRKWSASARWHGERGRAGEYVLAEWARTVDYSGTQPAFTFHSTLIEAALERGGWRGALRVERTERPEEERLADRFRSVRPHGDENILGITRWTTVSARVDRPVRVGAFDGVPFVEVSRLRVEETTGSIFVPEEFYGSDRHWSLSAGVRIMIGDGHGRMGRYGAARAEEQ